MINFACRMHLCQHSCCGPFAGVAADITNVEDRPFEEIVLTPEDYKKIYSALRYTFTNYYRARLRCGSQSKRDIDSRIKMLYSLQ